MHWDAFRSCALMAKLKNNVNNPQTRCVWWFYVILTIGTIHKAECLRWSILKTSFFFTLISGIDELVQQYSIAKVETKVAFVIQLGRTAWRLLMLFYIHTPEVSLMLLLNGATTPVLFSSLSDPFENRAAVHRRHGCPIFKWIAVINLNTRHRNCSLRNGLQGDMPYWTEICEMKSLKTWFILLHLINNLILIIDIAFWC